MTGSVVARCLQDALTPGLHANAWRALDSAASASLTDAAVKHGVEGWLRKRSRALGVLLPGVTEAVHAALARYQLAVEELGVVQRALQSVGSEFLIAKGPALVNQFYPGPELRSSVDLDVLVRPRDLSEVLAALEREGCTLLDANWPLLSRLRAHELRVEGPSGGLVDLHWSLGAGPEPKDSAPSAATLLDRSCEITVAGTPVRTLDWADTVVHLAVHAASSGGDRLIWYADLRAALAAAPDGGVELVARRAVEWGALPALRLILLRAQRAIGLVPDGALIEALDDSEGGSAWSARAWSALVSAVDRVAPVAEGTPGRRSIGRIVARSARHNAAASLRALGPKSARALLPGRPLDPDQLRDPEDPRSGLYDSGGAAGRKAFLESVRSAG